MLRRTILFVTAAMCFGSARADSPTKISVYKSPTCGCCGDWIRHLKAAGFETSVFDSPDLSPIKARAQVPAALQSCHTAFIGDYVVEGHVPAETLARLLSARPAIRGIAVPGMPLGSPGMEVPGEKPEPFRVLSFSESGATSVFEDFPNGYRRAKSP